MNPEGGLAARGGVVDSVYMRCMSSVVWLCAMFAASDVQAQRSSRPAAIVDSIVLERRPQRGGLACRECPPPRIVLHRATVRRGALEVIADEAARIGFYAMPPELRARVPFCMVLRSDALDASITMYHRDTTHSVGGYHHCVGGRLGGVSREPQLLRQLEAHIHRRHAHPRASRDLSLHRTRARCFRTFRCSSRKWTDAFGMYAAPLAGRTRTRYSSSRNHTPRTMRSRSSL
jgi:hypothetical protein